MEALSGVCQGVDPVHRRPVRRRQLAGLGIIETAPDVAPGDLQYGVGVDKAQARPGSDHDPVEDIEVGNLQYVLQRADLHAGAEQHGHADRHA